MALKLLCVTEHPFHFLLLNTLTIELHAYLKDRLSGDEVGVVLVLISVNVPVCLICFPLVSFVAVSENSEYTLSLSVMVDTVVSVVTE